jgi:hypothetical protein
MELGWVFDLIRLSELLAEARHQAKALGIKKSDVQKALKKIRRK